MAALKQHRFMANAETSQRDRSSSLTSFTLDEVENVGKEIGSGSYGVVIELEFRGLKCAGKKLHESLVRKNQPPKERQAILQRFEAECSILSHLRHPNIVQFLGVFYETNVSIPILVMEFLPMNLTRCIEDYGILPNEVAYSVLRDVALGLSYLHGFKPDPIVHRDLSANNVLLTADMTAKISDLGVARILNLTPSEMNRFRLTQAPGTPLYMPPEALRPNPHYNMAIDIYSFGVLILHIFSGKWPIPSEATTPDPSDPSRLIPKTEVERREEYFQAMGRNHPLSGLTKQCLNNHYPYRPHVKDVLSEVKSKLLLSTSTLTNKVQAILWEKHLRSNIESLQASVAVLKGSMRHGTGGAEGFDEKERAMTVPDLEALQLTPSPNFGRRLSQSFESVMTMPESNKDYKGTAGPGQELMTTEALSMMTTAGSTVSAVSYTPESGAYISPHPYQPGATLILTTDGCCDLPVAMYNGHTIVVEDKVYVGGGCTKDKKEDNTIFIYHMTDAFWSMLPPCPVTFFGLALIYNQIATIGGRIVATKGITNVVYTYDDDSKPEWKPVVPPMPTARHSLTVVSHASNIFACGGRDGEGISKAVEVFVAGDGQWFVTYPLPFPFYQMSSTVIHGTCYLLGGYDQFAFTDKVVYASLSALLEGATNQREQSAWKNLPSIRYNCATAANLGGCLLAVGGSRMLGGSRIDIYSQVKKAWIRLTDLAGRDAYFAPIVVELPSGKLLIIGGATSNLQPRNSMYMAKIMYH